MEPFCFCCGYRTILYQGGFEICPVCGWEDEDINSVDDTGGANPISLREARRNFARSQKAFPQTARARRMRPPLPTEEPRVEMGEDWLPGEPQPKE